jgi:hypothetical protein
VAITGNDDLQKIDLWSTSFAAPPNWRSWGELHIFLGAGLSGIDGVWQMIYGAEL